jgi:mycofactocin precursor
MLSQFGTGRAPGMAGAVSRLKEELRVKDKEETESKSIKTQESDLQAPDILEEIEIEDFAVDGICGVY